MKQNFNNNWLCYKTGDREHAFAVTLPHDAIQDGMRRRTTLMRKPSHFRKRQRKRK